MREIDFDSHRYAAQQEDIEWLVARGVPLEDACERVGVTAWTYEMRLRRAAERAAAAGALEAAS